MNCTLAELGIPTADPYALEPGDPDFVFGEVPAHAATNV